MLARFIFVLLFISIVGNLDCVGGLMYNSEKFVPGQKIYYKEYDGQFCYGTVISAAEAFKEMNRRVSNNNYNAVVWARWGDNENIGFMPDDAVFPVDGKMNGVLPDWW
jgi:hypothetical protein